MRIQRQMKAKIFCLSLALENRPLSSARSLLIETKYINIIYFSSRLTDTSDPRQFGPRKLLCTSVEVSWDILALVLKCLDALALDTSAPGHFSPNVKTVCYLLSYLQLLQITVDYRIE